MLCFSLKRGPVFGMRKDPAKQRGALLLFEAAKEAGTGKSLDALQYSRKE